MGIFLNQAEQEIKNVWRNILSNANEAILSGLDRSETANINQELINADKRQKASRSEFESELGNKRVKYTSQLADARENLRRTENSPPESKHVDYNTGRSKTPSLTNQAWWPAHYQKRLADWEENKNVLRNQIADMESAVNSFQSGTTQLLQAWDETASNMMQSIPETVGPNINPQAVAAAEDRGRQIVARRERESSPPPAGMLPITREDRALGIDPDAEAMRDVRERIAQDPTELQRIQETAPSFVNPLNDMSSEEIMSRYAMGGTEPYTGGSFGGGNQPSVGVMGLDVGMNGQAGAEQGAEQYDPMDAIYKAFEGITDYEGTTGADPRDQYSPEQQKILDYINRELASRAEVPISTFEELNSRLNLDTRPDVLPNDLPSSQTSLAARAGLYNRLVRELREMVNDPRTIDSYYRDAFDLGERRDSMPDSERRAEEERQAREARGEGGLQDQLSSVPLTPTPPTGESEQSIYKRLANEIWQKGNMLGINLTELQDIPIESNIPGDQAFFTVQQQIQSLQKLQETFDANKAALDQRDISADKLINNELNRRLSEAQSEQDKINADRDFEIKKRRLEFDIVNAQQSGRQVDERLWFDYKRAEQSANEANQALQLQRYQTDVANPFNVAALNLLGGGPTAPTGIPNVFAGGMIPGQAQTAPTQTGGTTQRAEFDRLVQQGVPPNIAYEQSKQPTVATGGAVAPHTPTSVYRGESAYADLAAAQQQAAQQGQQRQQARQQAGTIPQGLLNMGFQIPSGAQYGQQSPFSRFFPTGTPTLGDLSNLSTMDMRLLESVGATTGTSPEDIRRKAADITPGTSGIDQRRIVKQKPLFDQRTSGGGLGR